MGPAPPSGGDQLQKLATPHQHSTHHAAHHPRPPLSDVADGNNNANVTDAPPLFWMAGATRRARSTSYQSLDETRPAAISLEDHSEEDHAQAQSCWAQAVSIDEHSIVSGPSGVGAYVVWHCTVTTQNGGNLSIRKRYSEFDRLRDDLVKSFPHAAVMIPELPRKSFVSRFRPKFLEQRQAGLSHFLNCILLNPEFASSPMLKDFIFT